MKDHGVYPLLDTLTNDALLQTNCGDEVMGRFVDLYVDAKGFHLVWRTIKKNKSGDPIWNGGNMLLETKSKDVTAEFAAKLDYDGTAPDFDDTAKIKDDDPWFVTAPEVDDGYMFTICGLKDDEGTHVSHVFATDGEHVQLLLAHDSEAQTVSFEHTATAMVLDNLTSDSIEQAETDSDILSKAKELLK